MTYQQNHSNLVCLQVYFLFAAYDSTITKQSQDADYNALLIRRIIFY